MGYRDIGGIVGPDGPVGPVEPATEFKVSQAPQQTAEGSWTMTVDGHVLNKVN